MPQLTDRLTGFYHLYTVRGGRGDLRSGYSSHLHVVISSDNSSSGTCSNDSLTLIKRQPFQAMVPTVIARYPERIADIIRYPPVGTSQRTSRISAHPTPSAIIKGYDGFPKASIKGRFQLKIFATPYPTRRINTTGYTDEAVG